MLVKQSGGGRGLACEGVLSAGAHRGRHRRRQRPDGVCVQVLTQQTSQLLVLLPEVVLLLPQSFSLQHGAVEPPQQPLQLRELAELLEDTAEVSAAAVTVAIRAGAWAMRLKRSLTVGGASASSSLKQVTPDLTSSW